MINQDSLGDNTDVRSKLLAELYARHNCERVVSEEGYERNIIEQQNTEWTGHYTKIGEMVFCDFYARFTSGGATSSNGSSIRLTGLPFGIENTARVRGGGVTSYQNIASSSHSGIWSWYGSQNNTYATAYVGASNVTAANGAGQAGKYIIGTFSYQAKP